MEFKPRGFRGSAIVSLSGCDALVSPSPKSTRRIAATLFGTQSLTALTAVIVSLLAAREMGPIGRGELSYWLQLCYLAGTIAMFGIEKPYVAHHHTAYLDASRHQLLILKPGLTVYALGLGGILTIALTQHTHFTALLAAFAFMSICTTASRISRTSYISSGQTRLFIYVTVVPQVLLVCAAIIATMLHIESSTWWLLLYGISMLPYVILLIPAFRNRTDQHPLTRIEVSAVRKLGWQLIPASIGNTAMLRSDRILIPILSTTRELGFYAVVATTMELASWPVRNYTDAVLRQWRLKVEASSLPTMRYTLIASAITAVLSFLVGLLTVLMIHLFLGTEYYAALPLIIPLGVASVFYSASRILQGALIAHGLASRASASELAGMLISVVAYAALIPIWGGIGAAIGSVIGYAGCCLVTYLLTRAVRADRHKKPTTNAELAPANPSSQQPVSTACQADGKRQI